MCEQVWPETTRKWYFAVLKYDQMSCFSPTWSVTLLYLIDLNIDWYVCWTGEQGMIDEAQKALEEAEALKKVFHLA